jgi:hypothetical protein
VSGFKTSPQPPNSMVASPHDVAIESYAFYTTEGGMGHEDTCAMLSMEDGETGFRWSWRLNSGSFVQCVVGDNGHAFGAYQHQMLRIRVIAATPPKGCKINIAKTALGDINAGAVTHIENLRAALWEIQNAPGYRGIYNGLKAQPTPLDKVRFLVKHFEQSADQENDVRKRIHEFDYWDTFFKNLRGQHGKA